MAVSTIPAAKAALVARLLADVNLGVAGVAVTYGLPAAPARQISREWVFVGNSKPDDPTRGGSGYGGGQTSAMIGTRSREERYVLELIISVLQGQLETQQACTSRAFQIAGYIEASVRTWAATVPNAFDGVVRWAVVTAMHHSEGIVKSGDRVTDVFIDIAFAARI